MFSTLARPALLATAVLFIVLAVSTTRALADGPEGHEASAVIERSTVPQLVSSPHPAPGVKTRVLPGPVPGILLDATSARHLIVVVGAAGEPSVRISPRGVEVNVRSPGPRGDTAADTARPLEPAKARGAPRWRRIAKEARYHWVESRAYYPPERVPEDVVQGGQRRTLATWRVPLEVNGRRTELRGITTWVPLPGTAERGEPDCNFSFVGVPVAVLAVLTLVAGAGLFAIRKGGGGSLAHRTRLRGDMGEKVGTEVLPEERGC